MPRPDFDQRLAAVADLEAKRNCAAGVQHRRDDALLHVAAHRDGDAALARAAERGFELARDLELALELADADVDATVGLLPVAQLRWIRTMNDGLGPLPALTSTSTLKADLHELAQHVDDFLHRLQRRAEHQSRLRKPACRRSRP